MVSRIIVACGIVILVGLLLAYLVGPILVTTGIPFVIVAGEFLTRWGFVLALALAIIWLFNGWSWSWPSRPVNRP